MKTNRSCAATIGVLMALATATAQQFTEITTDPVVTDLGNSGFGAWADYDNDGYSDLFVTCDLGTTSIYRNNRNGTFQASRSRPGWPSPHTTAPIGATLTMTATRIYTPWWMEDRISDTATGKAISLQSSSPMPQVRLPPTPITIAMG
jgi:hypothetical protein